MVKHGLAQMARLSRLIKEYLKPQEVWAMTLWGTTYTKLVNPKKETIYEKTVSHLSGNNQLETKDLHAPPLQTTKNSQSKFGAFLFGKKFDETCTSGILK